MDLSVLVRLVEGEGGDEEGVVYECRRCSATLSSRRDTCEYCETDEVVRYEIR